MIKSHLLYQLSYAPSATPQGGREEEFRIAAWVLGRKGEIRRFPLMMNAIDPAGEDRSSPAAHRSLMDPAEQSNPVVDADFLRRDHIGRALLPANRQLVERGHIGARR